MPAVLCVVDHLACSLQSHCLLSHQSRDGESTGLWLRLILCSLATLPFSVTLGLFADTWLSWLNFPVPQLFFFFLNLILIIIIIFLINSYFIYLFIFGCVGSSFHARAFSSCGKRGPLFIAVRGPFTTAAPPAAGHRLQTRRLSSCGSQAQLLRCMWDLPRPGLEPVSPALEGRFSTTAPPGKPCASVFTFKNGENNNNST